MDCRLLSTVFLLIGLLASEANSECHVSIVAPNQIRINTQESLYLNFHECSPNVNVQAYIGSLPDHQIPSYEQTFNGHPQSEQLKIDFKIMEGNLERKVSNNELVKKAELEVTYCSEPTLSCNSKKKQRLTLNLNFTHGYAFMTTDRPAYRPSEKVQIVVVSTKQSLTKLSLEDLRPVTMRIRIPQEFGKIVVKETEERLDPNGMLEYTYQITEDPMKGIWWAEALIGGEIMASTSFVIDKYVTRTYDVNIIPDKPYILPTQQNIAGNILAKYSYGENVDGVYYLSMRLVRPNKKAKEFFRIPSSFSKSAYLVDGKQKFAVDIANIRNQLAEGETMQSLLDGSKVEILATVTTTGGSAEVVTDLYELVFTKSPYIIDYSQSSRFYVARTIYQVQAIVKDAVTEQPVENVPVKIQWNDQVKDLQSKSDGSIYDEIDSFAADSYTIEISTNDLRLGENDQFSESFTVEKYKSDKQLVISVKQGIQHFQFLTVGERYFLELDVGQSAPTDIRVYIISRGEILMSITKVAGRSGTFSVPFEATAEMVPECRILAYYVLSGEVTASSAWFDVEDQCKEEFSINMKANAGVNEGVNIEIEGPAHSKVYTSGVDRAAYFIHNSTRLTRNLLWKKMEAYDTACSIAGGRSAASVFRQAGMVIKNELVRENVQDEVGCERNGGKRKKRDVGEPGVVDDALFEFLEKCNNSGQTPFSVEVSCDVRAESIRNLLRDRQENKHIESCLRVFLIECSKLQRSRSKVNLARSVKVKRNQVQRLERAREDFSESWFFKSGTIEQNGKLVQGETTKDSITTFEVQAFGWGENVPFCVAPPKEIRVFQNFFIQIFMPYSVRVREQATIRYSVFNYNDEEMTTDIYIKHTDDLCSNFRFGAFRFMTTLTIDAKSSASSYFTILPIKIPDEETTTISLSAVVGQEEKDRIAKNLLIEKQGQHNESYGSFQLEPDTAPIDFRFDIATTSVEPDSRKCYIYLYSHLMGPSVEVNAFDGLLTNLDKYIQLPNYCGEQNMIRVGPLVYVHKYRLAAKPSQTTQAQTNQIINYIQRGYQIELGHRSEPDKIAFAVFKQYPPSTWLNAYVAKVFAQAKHFWKAMPFDPICKAVSWMLVQQAADGHYKENYAVWHHELRGFVVDDITRTAYVMISLTELKDACPGVTGLNMENSRLKAVNYLKGKLDAASGTPYALAMGAYAMAIHNRDGQVAWNWNERLKESRIIEGDFIHWEGTRGVAADIETTAYAMLAELTISGITQDNNERLRSIARWLISKRNDRGGFISTQETVVALQALSVYMTILETSSFKPPPTDLTVTLSSRSETSPWHLNPVVKHLTEEDTLTRKTIEVPETAIDEVTATVTGDGKGSISYRCTWRQFAADGECNFNVDVSLDPNPEGDSMKLKVSVTKVLGPPAQLSIIDISILSGYEPDEESIRRLGTGEFVDGQIDRYENVNNTVKLYLQNIDNTTRTLGFTIKEVAKINNRQPASVTVYDYGEPGIRCTKFYSETADSTLDVDCQGDDQTCKCAEGDCLKCRTRQEQLHNTTCSSYKNLAKRCRDLCSNSDIPNSCLNIHRAACNSDYAYVVQVKDVSQSEIARFKSVTAFVEQVHRTSARHSNVRNTNVTFYVRNDCYKACKDERLAEISKKKKNEEEINFIGVGRRLLVYGKPPHVDKNKNPHKIIYYLDEDAGVEIFPSADKCLTEPELKNCQRSDKKCKKKNKKLRERKKICALLNIFAESLEIGCDV